jgi:hypothetical protein
MPGHSPIRIEPVHLLIDVCHDDRLVGASIIHQLVESDLHGRVQPTIALAVCSLRLHAQGLAIAAPDRTFFEYRIDRVAARNTWYSRGWSQPMEPTKPKLPREAIELYNDFIHGEISRRAFMEGIQRLAARGVRT